ncbi:hypothetical protein ACN6MY_10925 [Peribacillus sp. B-H-3]|uniref:hypothetical protein n=1 Tax=Peribacillus sp. B-H-3 TaxID=3400420 RepID=UPI003B01EC6B
MRNKTQKTLEFIILVLSLAFGLFLKDYTYLIIGIVLFAGIRLFYYTKKKEQKSIVND